MFANVNSYLFVIKPIIRSNSVGRGVSGAHIVHIFRVKIIVESVQSVGDYRWCEKVLNTPWSSPYVSAIVSALQSIVNVQPPLNDGAYETKSEFFSSTIGVKNGTGKYCF